MVPLDKVQLGEVAATIQPVGEIMDVGHGVLVRNGDVVQSPLVATGPLTTIPLGHHLQGAGPEEVIMAEDADVLHLLEIGLGDGKHVRVQPALAKTGWPLVLI